MHALLWYVSANYRVPDTVRRVAPSSVELLSLAARDAKDLSPRRDLYSSIGTAEAPYWYSTISGRGADDYWGREPLQC